MGKRFIIILLAVCIAGGCAMVERHQKREAERVILWLDGTANFERLGTEEGIESVFDKARDIGVTDLVLCIKRPNGYVLYDSAYAPQLKEWQGFRRADDFEFVNTAMYHARQRGMKLHLSLNIFSEGNRTGETGRVYYDKSEWQTVLYTPEGLVPMIDYDKGYNIFTNPALPEVQEYQLTLLREAAEKYHPDGIILDRCRYHNLTSDFSDYSREQFEEYMVRTRNMSKPVITNWPQDILTWKSDQYAMYDRSYEPGPYFREWLEWRAGNIRQFVEKARETVKSVDSDIEFANYVGAWYPVYYELGVNWASHTFDVSREYDWATPEYKKTGFAELFDWLMVGNYFYEVTIEELQTADTLGTRTEDGMGEGREYWYSVEGSAQISMEVTKGVIPVYGSLYVVQYADHNDPCQFRKAIETLRRITDGVMIFDLVHLEQYGYWDAFEEGLKTDF